MAASARSLAAMVLLCPVFDLGLDFGFYCFHRVCHMNRWLYFQVHRDHHVDTAKEHGHLVAYETYTITWVETASITASYFIGLMCVQWGLRQGQLPRWVDFNSDLSVHGSHSVCVLNAEESSLPLCPSAPSVFEVVFLVCWGHYMELMGHTSMTITPKFQPERWVIEALGFDLQVGPCVSVNCYFSKVKCPCSPLQFESFVKRPPLPCPQVIDHTMHHKIPFSNFSKRMTLWDRVFGTYSPRSDKVVYKNGDEYRQKGNKNKVH